ncbi:MAG: DUF2282 domain-containing protein [Gammaproteobacteria bacterium]|nr:DUF2282 domain-containing protein [Gammaproteobacteria bacterium]
MSKHKRNKMMQASVVGAVILGIMNVADAAKSSKCPPLEHCYGIVKAGQNDCPTNVSQCAGSSTKDAQGDAYIDLPRGTCLKIVGGSLMSTVKKSR